MKYLIFLLLTLTSCTSLPLMFSSDESLNNDPIPGMLMDYFDTTHLYPVLDDRAPLGLAPYYTIVKTKDGGRFIKADLAQNGKHYEAVLGVRKLQSMGAGLVLYYLSADPDCLPSPELFYDVINQAFLLHPQIKDIYGCKVFIEPADSQTKDPSEQIWTFFNAREKIQTLVYLKPDGVGGTFFGVQPYPGDTDLK